MTTRLFRALLLAVIPLLVAVPVYAHAELVSSDPTAGQRVAGSPAEIVLTFNQDLDMSRTSVVLRDAAGTRIARGGELGDGPRELRLTVPPLAPGEYEVRWTSFSAEDGELFRDFYKFTVVAAPTPAPSQPTPTSVAASPSAGPSATLPATSAPSSGPIASDPEPATDVSVLLPIVAALVVGGGLAFWMLRRRRS